MIANGIYLRREIAYCFESEMEDIGYLPVKENLNEIFDHLLMIASDNPDITGEWEDYSKGVYHDNYYDTVDGIEYCLQHDIVTDSCVLYELKEVDHGRRS